MDTGFRNVCVRCLSALLFTGQLNAGEIFVFHDEGSRESVVVHGEMDVMGVMGRITIKGIRSPLIIDLIRNGNRERFLMRDVINGSLKGAPIKVKEGDAVVLGGGADDENSREIERIRLRQLAVMNAHSVNLSGPVGSEISPGFAKNDLSVECPIFWKFVVGLLLLGLFLFWKKLKLRIFLK